MKKIFIAEALLLLSLVSCGGSSGGSSSNGVGSTISAQFIDAPVKGLNVRNLAGEVAKTGDQGRFSCKVGEVVSFYLRDLKLGSAPCGSKIFVTDIAEGEKAFGVAAILQSLSTSTYTGANGQIDLSAIPDDAVVTSKISVNDLATPAAALAKAADVRDLATAADAFDNIALPTEASVRAHVATSISTHSPADTTLLSIAGAFNKIGVVATYVSGCTDTQDEKCNCYTTIAGDLELTKVGENGVTAELKAKACDEDENEVCDDESFGKKVITSTSFTLKDSGSASASIVEGDGVIKLTEFPSGEEFLLCAFGYDTGDGMEHSIVDCFKNNGNYYQAGSGNQQIQGLVKLAPTTQIPFTATYSLDMTVNLSGTNAAPVVSGTVTETGFDFDLESYTSETNYSLPVNTYSCVYKLENK